MKRIPIIVLFLAGLSVSYLGWAQSSAQDQSGQSLADIARKLKAQQGQNSTANRTYTNDDVAPAPSASGGKVEASGSESNGNKPDAAGAHGEKYFREAYSKLMGKKEMDERELEVLQKKLNQNNIQYYNGDPQAALKQQYSREDITKNQDEIDKKKKEIADVDQQLSDLQDELRRDSGDPSWLQGNPVSIEPTIADQKLPEDGKKMSKEYWQGEFKAARAALAHAQEAQKLVEDEVTFLKARRVQEPSPDAQKEINAKLDDRNAELDKAAAVTDKAKHNLDDLQQAFDASGAPAEWSALD
ncbi:MAG TPA: hypothetical protein VKV95_23530 [Terriglobia bacterium]|nr:hypothetical protein [Terriglobia bacterium]